MDKDIEIYIEGMNAVYGVLTECSKPNFSDPRFKKRVLFARLVSDALRITDMLQRKKALKELCNAQPALCKKWLPNIMEDYLRDEAEEDYFLRLIVNAHAKGA